MVKGRKPKGGRQGEYVSHPWEAVSLAPAAKLPHQRTMRCIPRQVGGTLGAWACGERCQTQSSPKAILQSRPLGAEMKYGRASHYTETCSSHLVIDGLGGGLCPHPPLRNCLLLRGLGIFEAMLENKRCFLFTHCPPCQPAHEPEDVHTREVHICGHARSFSQGYRGSSHPPSPQQ